LFIIVGRFVDPAVLHVILSQTGLVSNPLTHTHTTPSDYLACGFGSDSTARQRSQKCALAAPSVGYELARCHGQRALAMSGKIVKEKTVLSPCSLLVACPPLLAQRARCRHHRGKRVRLGVALILFIVSAVAHSNISRCPQGPY
jgi:hypothetical protein